MPEITEQQLQALTNAQALLRTLYQDPEDGLSFKQLLKKKFPKASIPEIDAAAPYVKQLQGLEKKIDDFIGAFTGSAKGLEKEQSINSAAKRFKLTEQGVADLRKLMDERKIDDPEVAAGFLVASAPAKPIEPSGYTGKRWDFFKYDGDEQKKDMENLLDDPEGWLETAVPRILNEERGNTVKLGG